MSGKVIKISSNDLYGKSVEMVARVYACFEHTKYMNNYVVFSIDGNDNLLFGSIHIKEKILVIFSVKDEIKKYISKFLDEYVVSKLENFRLIDIGNIDKIEMVSYNEMKYDNISLLDEMSISKLVKEEVVVEKKPILVYILIFILFLFALWITFLYFKPELFEVKYKMLQCGNNLYDDNLGLYYDVNKEIKFDKNDVVIDASVIRTYIFLDSKSYYQFKDNNNADKYFTNGEGYKYIDNELKFKLFYNENSVIDSYEEMLIYLKREGYSCIESEYEK